MKSLVWLADSLELVRAFPTEAKTEVGHELRRVQQGLSPGDWKSMPSIGLGVKEIRVNVGTAHRVFYVANFAEAVYVLHAMTKKTRKTPRRDIELCRKTIPATGKRKEAQMSARTVLTKGSRNVFADLGFPEGEAQNLALRSDLMIRIEKLVHDSGMTQQEAAKTLGVTQPRLNALLKGKIADFSLDALVNMLAHAGMQVRMTVKKAA